MNGLLGNRIYLAQWFSAFLLLQPFNTVPNIVTPSHKIIILLLFFGVFLIVVVGLFWVETGFFFFWISDIPVRRLFDSPQTLNSEPL